MMPKIKKIKLAVVVAALVLSGHAVLAQSEKTGVEKLYVLNCGEGTAGDISRWTPGLNEGKTMDFVDSCYLVKHAKGWFLWDTGIADAVAAMPNGLAPADPKAVTWRRPKTLAAQLEQLGLKPGDVKMMAVSHTHPDHTGNVELFPQAMLYVQKAEYDWPGANNEPRFAVASGRAACGRQGRVRRRQRDHPVDARPYAGTPIAAGDAAEDRRRRAVGRCGALQRQLGQPPCAEHERQQGPERGLDAEDRRHARQGEGATWINHDKIQRDSQKMSPEFYD